MMTARTVIAVGLWLLTGVRLTTLCFALLAKGKFANLKTYGI